jgi:dTDP-4-dehydrorhamnose reductase
MKVVVLGRRGMLGTDLVALAPPTVTVEAFARSEVDVTSGSDVERMLRESAPDVVINATAFTQVDRAEEDSEHAFAVNANAVRDLATRCATRGIRVVHFSTDYVFDGASTHPYREDDPGAPVNVYGASKLAGEQALRASGASHLLLRTSWLFGGNGQSFPRTMWQRAAAHRATRVVADQRGRPTYTHDLAHATWAAIAAGLTGTYHAANEGNASWFEVALRIFDSVGAGDCLQPCSTAEYPTQARRPGYSVLETDKLRRAGIALPTWANALDRFIDVLRGEAPMNPGGLRQALS